VQHAVNKQDSYSTNNSRMVTVLPRFSVKLQYTAQESAADAGTSIGRNGMGVMALANQSLPISLPNPFASLQKHNDFFPP